MPQFAWEADSHRHLSGHLGKERIYSKSEAETEATKIRSAKTVASQPPIEHKLSRNNDQHDAGKDLLH